MDTKAESSMELSIEEKWKLFGQNFESCWFGGFYLIRDAAKIAGPYGGIIPMAAGIIHLANLGILTSLIPSSIGTMVDLSGREYLKSEDFHETLKYLKNTSDKNINLIARQLVETVNAYNRNSSFVWEPDLTEELKKLESEFSNEWNRFFNAYKKQAIQDEEARVLDNTVKSLSDDHGEIKIHVQLHKNTVDEINTKVANITDTQIVDNGTLRSKFQKQRKLLTAYFEDSMNHGSPLQVNICNIVKKLANEQSIEVTKTSGFSLA